MSSVSHQTYSYQNKKPEKERFESKEKFEFEEKFELENKFELELEKKFELELEKKLEDNNNDNELGDDNEDELENDYEIKKKKILELVTNDNSNKVFNPMKHRTQGLTRDLYIKDKVFYWNKLWTSINLLPNDCASSTQIKITTIKDLMIKHIIKQAYINNDFNFNTIPLNFFNLTYNNINNINTNEKKENKKWIAFGKWLGMRNAEKNLDSKKVRNHIRNKWKKIKKELKIKNVNELSDSSKIKPYKSRSLNELKSKGFRLIVEPEYIINSNNQTLIHFNNLNNDNVFIKAIDELTEYYFHTLKNPSYRSKGFWKNFVEHLGVFVKNNSLPYTSSDMASTHNIDHLPCVHKLIHALEPLSNTINQFINDNYSNMYEKLSKLSWGPFAPKPFGVYPIIVINFNTISDYHLDSYDEKNSLCVLVALGDFEGSELCFSQLKIVIQLKLE